MGLGEILWEGLHAAGYGSVADVGPKNTHAHTGALFMGGLPKMGSSYDV